MNKPPYVYTKMEMTPKLKRVLWAVMFDALTYRGISPFLDGVYVGKEMAGLIRHDLVSVVRADGKESFVITDRGRKFL